MSSFSKARESLVIGWKNTLTLVNFGWAISGKVRGGQALRGPHQSMLLFALGGSTAYEKP